MMKNKHNKKRNTAFIYEALVKEATAAILKNDDERKNKVVNLLKKYFNSNSILSKDLDCYRSLYETQGISEGHSRKLISEARGDKMLIDPTGLFNLQTQVINDINKEVDSDIFNNFVPNYKTLATIDQLFSLRTTPKKRVMLENELVSFMTQDEKKEQDNNIDSVVITTFVEKFNQKYCENLLEEQKELLTHYISSFTDNSLELKMFINDEVERLKTQLKEAENKIEFIEDDDMSNKLSEVINKLESFTNTNIDDEVLLTVLKTQNLTKEIYSNGSDN